MGELDIRESGEVYKEIVMQSGGDLDAMKEKAGIGSVCSHTLALYGISREWVLCSRTALRPMGFGPTS